MALRLKLHQADILSRRRLRRRARASSGRRSQGFTLVELILTILVLLVLMAIALPSTMNTLRNLRLSAAVAAASGAISVARYQAIMHAYPYSITFNASNANYQMASEPPTATSFTNVGSAVPLSAPGSVTINQTTTLQFNPNGTVVATTGGLSFTVSNGLLTKTISVTGVGDVSVN
jgi:prepilin-type N-terminal cleavage/methylation domain-containing protein